jgi:hypothetical protein
MGQGVCLPLMPPSQVSNLLDSGIMGAMKRAILLLSVLLAMAGTAPASAAFLGANPRLGESLLNTGIEQVAGDVSPERLPGFGGAWLRRASEFFVAPGAVDKSIRRHNQKLAREACANRPGKPQYENPGHHDPRNLPGKAQYNPSKGPLPSDAHTAWESAIEFEGKYYSRSASGEYYQYNMHHGPGEAGRPNGAVHFAGRNGKGYGDVDVPKPVRDHFEKGG